VNREVCVVLSAAKDQLVDVLRYWQLLVGLTILALAAGPTLAAQIPPAAPIRLDTGRVTLVYYPSEARLARTFANMVLTADSFPGLPRPKERILVALAPDAQRFREWVGPFAPEWGAAVAFPDSRRIIMQGKSAGSDAGDPTETFRHELAHLALHEAMGNLPPRWFDEGYASFAAHEWNREDVLATNLGLVIRGMPKLDQLEARFEGGSASAQEGYALAYRAVSDLSELGGERGLAPLFASWKEQGSLEKAVRLTYGITLTDFEEKWQRRTRLRYGMLALVSNLALAGVLVSLVLLPLYLARRRRDQARLAAMIVADAKAEAAAAAADPLADLLDPTSQQTGTPPGAGPPS
jgi:hypothetical protein